MDGILGISTFFDTAGPMAKSARDLLPLVELMLKKPRKFIAEENFSHLKLGFVDPKIWTMADAMCGKQEGPAEQIREEYEIIMKKIKENAGIVKYPIEVPPVSEFVKVEGEPAVGKIAFWEFKNYSIPRFLEFQSESKVQLLQDIVDFNEKYKHLALRKPFNNQDDLKKALAHNEPEEHIEKLRVGLRKLSIEAMEKVFHENDIDILVAPADSALAHPAATAGYPIAVTPLGALKYNNRPFGLCLVSKACREDLLLHFLTAFETHFPERPVPNLRSD